MKGIILAGGSGTRLHPITKVFSKQLLPVYNKPMIFYPLSVLMLAKIKDILIITTPEDQPLFKKLLGDGRQWCINLQYKTQEKPNGLAEAFIIAEDFIKDSPCALILGDNIIYRDGLQSFLDEAKQTVIKNGGAVICSYAVSDPERYGVVSFGPDDQVLDLEEKPAKPKSNQAVIGLYFYDAKVVNMAKKLKPSPRGELEITDLNREYLKMNQLKLKRLGRGAAWLDMGTFDSLLESSNFVQILSKRQGMQIADLNEIARHLGYLT